MALATPGGPGKMPLPASVAVVRISVPRRGSRSNSGQKRRGRRELEQHGTRGSALTAGGTLKVTPTFCRTCGSTPSTTSPGRRRGNCKIPSSEDSLFSFHCRADAKSRSLITYYGRRTVQFITDCEIKDASPKHAATFCIRHQKSCNVPLWFHGDSRDVKDSIKCHLFLIAIKYRRDSSRRPDLVGKPELAFSNVVDEINNQRRVYFGIKPRRGCDERRGAGGGLGRS